MKYAKFYLLLLLITSSAVAQVSVSDTLISRSRAIQVDKIEGLYYPGISFYIETVSQNIVALKDKKILWRAELMTVCGKPEVGKPQIRNVEVRNDKLYVTYGKHNYAEIDISNGAISCLGAD